MKKDKGVTVVELLVYLGLLGIFLVILLDVFTTTINFKLKSESTSALNMDSRYILSKLSYDIYNADSFTVPSNTQLNLVKSGVTSTYTISSGNLVLNGTRLNSSDTSLDSVSFTKIGDTVKTSFTLRSQIEVKGQTETLNVDTTLGIR